MFLSTCFKTLKLLKSSAKKEYSSSQPLEEPTQHSWLAAIRGAFHRCNHSSACVSSVEVGTEEAIRSNEAIAILWAISKCPTQTPPTQGSTANVDKILHQNIGGVLCTAASCLQHGKASMHEHDESSTKAKPCRIKSSTKSLVSLLQFCDFIINRYFWGLKSAALLQLLNQVPLHAHLSFQLFNLL